MTITEAIAVLGCPDVRYLVDRYPGGVSHASAARAWSERLDGWRSHAEAYDTLAHADEADVRPALAAIDSLSEAALEGSGRALKGLQERGIELPRDARYVGAWL